MQYSASLMQYWQNFWKTNTQQLIEFLEEKNPILKTAWVQKIFLNKPCHFNFAIKHTESTRSKIICMRGFYGPQKAFDNVSHDILQTLNLKMIVSGPI